MVDCLSPPPDKDSYTQVKLRCQEATQVTWLPSELLRIGHVKFKGDARVWFIVDSYKTSIGPPERDHQQFQYEKRK